MHLVSPGVVLAIALILIAAQVTRVAKPGRGPYLLTLGLAALGLVAGELLALTGHLQGPSLGVLHPFPDIAAIVMAELVGTWVLAPRR